jgi:hypothetical protein
MMNAQSLLREQLERHHEVLEATIGDCTPETIGQRVDGATIDSIGTIYAHTIYSEDALVQGMIQGRPPLFHSQGWAERTGTDLPQNPVQGEHWQNVGPIDLERFRPYAQAVYAATAEYLDGAADEEMQRVVDTRFRGEMPVWAILSHIVAWHAANHTGEIAALKGVHGLRGLPF